MHFPQPSQTFHRIGQRPVAGDPGGCAGPGPDRRRAAGIGHGTSGTWRPQIRAGGVLGDWELPASHNADKSRGYRDTDPTMGLSLFRKGYPFCLNPLNIELERYPSHYRSCRAACRNSNNRFGFSLGGHAFNEDLYGGKQNPRTPGDRLIGTAALHEALRSFGILTVRFGRQRHTWETQSTSGSLRVSNGAIAGRYVFPAADANTSYVYDPRVIQLSTPSYTRLPQDAHMDIHALRGHMIAAGVTCLAVRRRSLPLSPDRQRTMARPDCDTGQTAGCFRGQYKFAGVKAPCRSDRGGKPRANMTSSTAGSSTTLPAVLSKFASLPTPGAEAAP